MLPSEYLALELHDSTLRGVAWAGGDLILKMRVYVHSSPGRPGWDAGSGWFQDAEFVLLHAEIQQHPSEQTLDVLDGSMTVGSVALENLLPLPWSASSAVTLRLSGTGGALVAKSTGGYITLLGAPGDVEDYTP